jgi:cell division protein FtsQ
MRAHRSIQDTGRGVHAKRRVSIAPRQPLKPRYSARRSGVLLALLLASVGILAQQNRAAIENYINRPVVKIRMDVNWQQLDENEIGNLLAGIIGKGFIDIDVEQVKQRLEQHPWIAQASVQRVWPDSLALEITEHVAIARWRESELLNQYGEIFKPAQLEHLGTLPRLQGPQDSQFAMMQQYQKFSQVLFPSGLRLTELKLSPRGSWDLTLNESMHVAVGRTNLNEKLERFVKFYEAQPKSSSDLFDSIDLRYGNGIAIKNKVGDLTGVAIR